jgi:hypothetical protein
MAHTHTPDFADSDEFRKACEKAEWRSTTEYFSKEDLKDSVDYANVQLDRCHRIPNHVLFQIYQSSKNDKFRRQVMAFSYSAANIRPDSVSVNRDRDRDTHFTRETAMWKDEATDTAILKQAERFLTAVSKAVDSEEFGEVFVAKMLRSITKISGDYCNLVARLNKTGMPLGVKEAIDAARAKESDAHTTERTASSSRETSGGCGCGSKCATVQCPCKKEGAVCANSRCGCDSAKCQNRRGKK